MSSTTVHPHVKVIEGMTAAAISGDKSTLAKIFTDDMQFHVRGPLPKAGDHDGVDGFTDVIGTIFELTDGDDPKAKIALSTSSDDLLALVRGDLDVTRAVTSRRVSIKANPFDLMKLRKLL